MRLEDIISFDDAEALIEQHDRYSVRGCDIQRLPSKANGLLLWFVYYRGRAISTYESPSQEVKGHMSLARAIEAAHGFATRLEDGEITP